MDVFVGNALHTWNTPSAMLVFFYLYCSPVQPPAPKPTLHTRTFKYIHRSFVEFSRIGRIHSYRISRCAFTIHDIRYAHYVLSFPILSVTLFTSNAMSNIYLRIRGGVHAKAQARLFIFATSNLIWMLCMRSEYTHMHKTIYYSRAHSSFSFSVHPLICRVLISLLHCSVCVSMLRRTCSSSSTNGSRPNAQFMRSLPVLLVSKLRKTICWSHTLFHEFYICILFRITFY